MDPLDSSEVREGGMSTSSDVKSTSSDVRSTSSDVRSPRAARGYCEVREMYSCAQTPVDGRTPASRCVRSPPCILARTLASIYLTLNLTQTLNLTLTSAGRHLTLNLTLTLTLTAGAPHA